MRKDFPLTGYYEFVMMIKERFNLWSVELTQDYRMFKFDSIDLVKYKIKLLNRMVILDYYCVFLHHQGSFYV